VCITLAQEKYKFKSCSRATNFLYHHQSKSGERKIRKTTKYNGDFHSTLLGNIVEMGIGGIAKKKSAKMKRNKKKSFRILVFKL
jgi:hypothetical protein